MASPFLRWAGGKRLLVSKLVGFLPKDRDDNGRYIEPFLGAASLFFAVRPRLATLSDANHHLIDCLREVRRNSKLVAKYLVKHRRLNSKAHYYSTRELYNRSDSSCAQAARFIYLNSTCFNGIFRVNLNDEFNVPFGKKPNPQLPSTSDLLAVSKALRHVRIVDSDYHQVVASSRRKDFLYLDPPYPPLNGTSYFAHYTMDRFSHENHEELADAVIDAANRGTRILMTNADTPRIKKLYRDFNIRSLNVVRYVTCKSVRPKVGELIITSY